MLEKPPAVLSQYSQGMRLVNHEKTAVTFLDLYKLRKIRNIAVHAEKPLGNQEGSSESAPVLVKDLAKCREAVVGIRKILSTGKLYAFNNAVMAQAVIDYQITFPEKSADGADIGGMTADKYQSVICSINAGQLLFQIPVKCPFPRHQSAGSDRSAV